MTLSPADATVGTDTHVHRQHKHIVTMYHVLQLRDINKQIKQEINKHTFNTMCKLSGCDSYLRNLKLSITDWPTDSQGQVLLHLKNYESHDMAICLYGQFNIWNWFARIDQRSNKNIAPQGNTKKSLMTFLVKVVQWFNGYSKCRAQLDARAALI